MKTKTYTFKVLVDAADGTHIISMTITARDEDEAREDVAFIINTGRIETLELIATSEKSE